MSVATFSELNLAPALLTALQEENYHTPTAIQAQTIPLILADADVMGSAQTGTGKTAAFVLPLLHNLLSAEVLPDAVKVLILTPTRELAQQVFASVSVMLRILK